MSPTIFFLIFCVCAGLISYQDFKSREISVRIILLFIIATTLRVFFSEGEFALLSNFISSTSFLVLWGSAICLYYFVKEKKLSNFMETKLGWADVLILFGIGLSTDLISFIIFISASSVLALLFSLPLIKANKTIPLAGIFMIFFILFEGVSLLIKRDLIIALLF
jgi:Flp pilus assembly protein protease CpaA